MRKYRRVTNTIITAIASLSLIFLIPAVSWADSSSDTCTPPPSSSPGVHWPTGASAGTYTYQCSGQYAGDWTNQYYVFDPTTSTYTPLYSPDYSYDCTTGVWTMTQYDYNAATAQYVQDRVTTTAPALPTNCPVTQTTPDSSGNSSTDGSGTNTPDSSGGGSGPNSSNGSTTNVNNNVNDANNNNLTLSNNDGSSAVSGNAIVTGNTTAGNATSGNVQNEQDIINAIQASSGSLGNGTPVATFTDNINGDVNGDLLIDPATLSNIQSTGPDSSNLDNTNLNNNLTVNNSTDASINNNVNLDANSGNATVSGNTSAGNATSGNAENIANIVNSIDSDIESGQSFIGTININGDLNGDILLPQNLVDELLADNVPTVNITGPGSSNSGSTNVNNNTTVTNTNNLGINNSVTSNATSGNASVSNNTSAGNATSGNASTNITAFNLTGSNVIGTNDLLVFVNVTGNWVGLILNAPAGTTAAEFGGGITSTGPSSSNSTNTNVNNNTAVSNNVNEQINNNINTDASSGNATVSGNTKGGNATSGDAKNAVNLLNVENSSINLSGWFGILFINVFGTWNGSLGIAGDSGVSGASSSTVKSADGGAPVFRFIPRTGAAGSNSKPSSDLSSAYGGYSGDATNGDNSLSAVLASVTKPATEANSLIAPRPQLSGSHSTVAKTAITIGSLVVAYIVLDALFTNRAKVKSFVKTKISK